MSHPANPYKFPPSPGLGNVGSYQVSGIPYVTGALDCTITDGVMLEFPYVTSWVVVSNTGEEDEFLKIGFSQEGVKGTFLYGSGSYILPIDQQTPRLELKLTRLFLSGSTSVSVISVVVPTVVTSETIFACSTHLAPVDSVL